MVGGHFLPDRFVVVSLLLIDTSSISYITMHLRAEVGDQSLRHGCGTNGCMNTDYENINIQ